MVGGEVCISIRNYTYFNLPFLPLSGTNAPFFILKSTELTEYGVTYKCEYGKMLLFIDISLHPILCSVMYSVLELPLLCASSCERELTATLHREQ